jgi:hypothetical protein
MNPSIEELRAGVIIIGHHLDGRLASGVADRLIELGLAEAVEDRLSLTKRGEVPLAKIESGDDADIELCFE